jgi:hypothetical protein
VETGAACGAGCGGLDCHGCHQPITTPAQIRTAASRLFRNTLFCLGTAGAAVAWAIRNVGVAPSWRC